jgi:hypothetical protein
LTTFGFSGSAKVAFFFSSSAGLSAPNYTSFCVTAGRLREDFTGYSSILSWSLSKGFTAIFFEILGSGYFSAGLSSVYPNGLATILTGCVFGFCTVTSSAFFSKGLTVAFLATMGFSVGLSSSYFSKGEGAIFLTG